MPFYDDVSRAYLESFAALEAARARLLEQDGALVKALGARVQPVLPEGLGVWSRVDESLDAYGGPAVEWYLGWELDLASEDPPRAVAMVGCWSGHWYKDTRPAVLVGAVLLLPGEGWACSAAGEWSRLKVTELAALEGPGEVLSHRHPASAHHPGVLRVSELEPATLSLEAVAEEVLAYLEYLGRVVARVEAVEPVAWLARRMSLAVRRAQRELGLPQSAVDKERTDGGRVSAGLQELEEDGEERVWNLYFHAQEEALRLSQESHDEGSGKKERWRARRAKLAPVVTGLGVVDSEADRTAWAVMDAAAVRAAMAAGEEASVEERMAGLLVAGWRALRG